jgi:hypothetical protein
MSASASQPDARHPEGEQRPAQEEKTDIQARRTDPGGNEYHAGDGKRRHPEDRQGRRSKAIRHRRIVPALWR